MKQELKFVETITTPVCPFCDIKLKRIHFHRQKLSFGFMSGFAWVILLSCPQCHKVLGTQTWD